MIPIFVCEDDHQHLKNITEFIEKFIMINELELKLELSTSDPAEIIEFIKNKKVEGLYFLDIELEGGQNGVEVARSIREYDTNGTIAFVTSHPGYRDLTFKYNIEALDYVQKGNEDEVYQRVTECINRAHQKYIARHEATRFSFKVPSRGELSCRYEDILFFEADPSVPCRIILHTDTIQYTYYYTLDKLLKELPKNIFFKCHRSYIVNLNNITENCRIELAQGKGNITMPNGAECKVSVGNRRALLKFLEVVRPL